jgi:UDP-GlcNAc:undecaprenyl-phosphate/decaprenyl-phosphate GlcNAc-1-phosphate transferase
MRHKFNPSVFTQKATSGRLSLLLYFAPFFIFLLLLQYYVETRYAYLVDPLVKYFPPCLSAFLLALILVPVCMKAARRFNVVDRGSVKPGRASPVPLLGGVGIFASFLIAASFYQPWPIQLQAIILASSIIFLIGTIDDIYPLSSVTRLCGQLLAAGIVIAAGLKVSFLPQTWWGEGLAWLITATWLLGIINATNFADGVDGLAAGFSVIAAIFFFLITFHLNQTGPALLAAILIGCGIGFLVFNFKPAKIYLGDGGSTFLGFMLACLALYGGWSSWGAVIALGIPVLILSVLIFDMIYITISRIRNGHVRNFREWLDYRGNDHFHHRLIRIGFTEEQAVFFIYFTSIILGLSALVIEHARVSYPVVVLLIQATMIFLNITILMLIGRETTT